MENTVDEATTLIPNPGTVIIPTLEAYLNQFRARYLTSGSEYESRIQKKGGLTDYNFYITDLLEIRDTHIAFRMAYDVAIKSKDNKELCACVVSMICDIFTAFEYTMGVDAVWNRLGIKIVGVWLPSNAHKHKIKVEDVPKLDWPSILVYFGCCILLLFVKSTDEVNYKNFMCSRIRDLRDLAGCDPEVELNIPFDFKRGNAISTMLGSNSKLREDLILFLMYGINRGEIEIGGVCQYLCKVLSWFMMGHFTLINEELVKPHSPVLLDPRVSLEVENFKDACAAIASHPFPQFFMIMSSNFELLKVDPLRFPTLIAVAQELQRENDNAAGANASNSESISIAGANPRTVQSLLKLHRKAESGRQKLSRTTVLLD